MLAASKSVALEIVLCDTVVSAWTPKKLVRLREPSGGYQSVSPTQQWERVSRSLFLLVKKMTGPRNQERLLQIKSLILAGKSYEEIASVYGISRQAISYFCRTNGIDKLKNPKQIEKNRTLKKRISVDAKWRKLHGVGYTEMMILRSIGAVLSYREQRNNAMSRDIPWQFNLATWWDLWYASGKWDMRGIGKTMYVMARFNDVGPYHPNNVEIITHSKNSSDARANEKIKKGK